MTPSLPGSPAAPVSLIRQVDRVSARQRGLITAGQLDQLGLGPSGRYWAAASGRLLRIRAGVFQLPGVPPTWETAILAAVLAAGPDAVASHLTAGHLWDLFDGRPPTGLRETIHITAPKLRRITGVRVHRRQLADEERSSRRSVPVTSVARTLFDLASMLDVDGLGRCTDEAIRRGVLDLRHLRGLLDGHGGGGRRRLRPLQLVLGERVAGFDPGANEWELRMDRLWDALGLPAAERQYVIVTKGGRYRVDRAVVDLRLAVEWVGSEFHGQRGRFSRDRVRISDLVQAGWDVVEVTPNWTPERVQRTVLAKVADRAGSLSPATG